MFNMNKLDETIEYKAEKEMRRKAWEFYKMQGIGAEEDE